MNNSNFQAGYRLVAPAGEEIPVMLVSQSDTFRYRVISEVEYEEQSTPLYEWHPSEGVTYRGFPLPGLEILSLNEEVSSPVPSWTPSWGRLLGQLLSRFTCPLLRSSL